MLCASRELLCSFLIIQHVAGTSWWSKNRACYPNYGRNYGFYNGLGEDKRDEFAWVTTGGGNRCDCGKNECQDLSSASTGSYSWPNYGYGTNYGWGSPSSSTKSNGWTNMRQPNSYSNGAAYNTWTTPYTFGGQGRWNGQGSATSSYAGFNGFTNSASNFGVTDTSNYQTNGRQSNRKCRSTGCGHGTHDNWNGFAQNGLNYGTATYAGSTGLTSTQNNRDFTYYDPDTVKFGTNSERTSRNSLGYNNFWSSPNHGGFSGLGYKTATNNALSGNSLGSLTDTSVRQGSIGTSDSFRTATSSNSYNHFNTEMRPNSWRTPNNYVWNDNWSSFNNYGDLGGISKITTYKYVPLTVEWDEMQGLQDDAFATPFVIAGNDGQHILADGVEIADQGTAWNTFVENPDSTNSLAQHGWWNTIRTVAGCEPWHNANDDSRPRRSIYTDYVGHTPALNGGTCFSTIGHGLEGLDWEDGWIYDNGCDYNHIVFSYPGSDTIYELYEDFGNFHQ